MSHLPLLDLPLKLMGGISCCDLYFKFYNKTKLMQVDYYVNLEEGNVLALLHVCSLTENNLQLLKMFAVLLICSRNIQLV